MGRKKKIVKEDDGIFKTKTGKASNKENIVITYNENAESIDDEREIVFAKYEKVGEIDFYYCLIDRTGHLYNFSVSGQILPSNRRRFRLTKVNEDCFVFYSKYLSTRNMVSWKSADRLVCS